MDGGPEGLNYEAFIKADATTAPYPDTLFLTGSALFEPLHRILIDEILG